MGQIKNILSLILRKVRVISRAFYTMAAERKTTYFKEKGRKLSESGWTGSNISNMRCSVSSPDETPRRELKIRRAAEYF